MSLESWLLQLKIIPFLRKDPFLSLLWIFLRQNNSTSLKNKRKESTKRSTLFMVITTSRKKKQSRKKYEREKVTADIITKLLILHRFLSRLTNWRLDLRLHTSSSSLWWISKKNPLEGNSSPSSPPRTLTPSFVDILQGKKYHQRWR